MFKYKKMALFLCTFLFVIFFIIELIKYLFVDSNIFGLIYLINNLFIIFMLIPCAYNYKKYYSFARITKLIIIILFGIFNSYILEHILLSSIGVTDSSTLYIDKIFIYKNIFKGIIYFVISVITVFEFKVEKLLKTIRKD